MDELAEKGLFVESGMCRDEVACDVCRDPSPKGARYRRALAFGYRLPEGAEDGRVFECPRGKQAEERNRQ